MSNDSPKMQKTLALMTFIMTYQRSFVQIIMRSFNSHNLAFHMCPLRNKVAPKQFHFMRWNITAVRSWLNKPQASKITYFINCEQTFLMTSFVFLKWSLPWPWKMILLIVAIQHVCFYMIVFVIFVYISPFMHMASVRNLKS
mgnify:CR=1 FL=1